MTTNIFEVAKKYGMDRTTKDIQVVANYFSLHDVVTLDEAFLVVSNIGYIMDRRLDEKEFDELALFFAIEGMNRNGYMIFTLHDMHFIRFVKSGIVNVYNGELENVFCFTVCSFEASKTTRSYRQFRQQCEDWFLNNFDILEG